MQHWDMIVIILTIVGSVVTLTINMRHFSDNIRKDAGWRANVDTQMKHVAEKQEQALESQKNMSADVQKLLSYEAAIREIFNGRRKEIDLLWKKVDEQNEAINDLSRRP